MFVTRHKLRPAWRLRFLRSWHRLRHRAVCCARPARRCASRLSWQTSAVHRRRPVFGLTGMPVADMPRNDAPEHRGMIGYHIRSGEHDLARYDWERFMDFADARLKAPGLSLRSAARRPITWWSSRPRPTKAATPACSTTARRWSSVRRAKATIHNLIRVGTISSTSNAVATWARRSPIPEPNRGD